MPAYMVFTRLRTRNPEEVKLYAEQAPKFLAGHTIKFLAQFGRFEVKEGNLGIPQLRRGRGLVREPCVSKREPASAQRRGLQCRHRGGSAALKCGIHLAPTKVIE
jgi:Domain of unknown function (DUF1330)